VSSPSCSNRKGRWRRSCELYEEALLPFLECGSDDISGGLLMLKDLIEFHERLNYQEQLDGVKRQYPTYYTSLEMGGHG
jgi:hypothetical protein